jgi:hypothetical protein
VDRFTAQVLGEFVADGGAIAGMDLSANFG